MFPLTLVRNCLDQNQCNRKHSAGPTGRQKSCCPSLVAAAWEVEVKHEQLHRGDKETMAGPSRSYRCLVSAFTTPLCPSFPAPGRAAPQPSQQPTVTAGNPSPSQTCQSPCLQSPSLEKQEENPLYRQFILELMSEIRVMLCCLATGWE